MRWRSLAHDGDPGPVPTLALEEFEHVTVSGPQTPSSVRPQLRWKSSSARAVCGPKIPSTRPAVEPEAIRGGPGARRRRRRAVGAARAEQPVAERPAGLDQGRPGAFVAHSVGMQAPCRWKRARRAPGDGAELSPARADWRGTGGTEAALRSRTASPRSTRSVSGRTAFRVWSRGIRRAPGAARPCPWRRRGAWRPRRRRTRSASGCS